MQQVSNLIVPGGTAPQCVPQTYAQKVNSKYSNSASLFVDLKKRIDDTINALPPFKQIGLRGSLKNAMEIFEKSFPHVKRFTDLQLVDCHYRPLSDILIDITMQRKLDLAWVITLLKKFCEVQAVPIQVYQVVNNKGELSYYPSGDDLYASWDGQHTAVLLYIIAVWILGEDPTKVMVPVNIYPVSKKSVIRQVFVSNNSSDGKKLLEDIDYFQQMIYGVRVDGNTNKDWETAELKQQYLEMSDLFVTADKFGDTQEPGAISRMQEINHYSSDIIRKFAIYTTTIQNPRPIASQEIEIMCRFFDVAKAGGCDYTDDEIIDLGQHLHELFDANFHESSPLWDKVRTAYNNWWDDFYDGIPDDRKPARSRVSKNWTTGGPFIWHQLKKTWSGRLPRMINSPFQPFAKDLY
jgi:hypothetical protein